MKSMFARYYEDLKPTMHYVCTESKHPQKDDYWMTRLIVEVWDESKGAYKKESVHTHHAGRPTAELSMEDAAYEAYLYYHGRRYEAMENDGLRYFPRFMKDDGLWTITDVANDEDPTLYAQVSLTIELLKRNLTLQKELVKREEVEADMEETIDEMRELRGELPKYDILPNVPVFNDVAP